MENIEKTKECLAWLNENYDLTSLSVADIVDLTITWNNKDAMEFVPMATRTKEKRR